MRRRQFIKQAGAAGLYLPASDALGQIGVRYGGAVKPASANTLLTGLVAFWKLDEASGTRNDSFGTNHLTDNNSVGQATGIGGAGNSASFNGSNQYLSIADNAALSMGDIDFTISVWVYIATSASLCLLAKDASGSNREFRFWLVTGTSNLAFLVMANGGANQDVQWGSSLSLNTWYHLVSWHDSVNNQVGIAVNNGTPVTQSFSGGSVDSTAAFEIGRLASTGDRYFNGRIQNVGIWKKVLSSTERTTLYNGGAGLAYPF